MILPLTSALISTWVSGWILPVALTVWTIFWRATLPVCTSRGLERRPLRVMPPPIAPTATTAKIPIHRYLRFISNGLPRGNAGHTLEARLGKSYRGLRAGPGKGYGPAGRLGRAGEGWAPSPATGAKEDAPHRPLLGRTGSLEAGGMGAVVRSRDTQLDRNVAIESLQERLSRGPERLARLGPGLRHLTLGQSCGCQRSLRVAPPG